jgi:WD40 repeat protein
VQSALASPKSFGVNGLDFSRCGKFLASCGDDNKTTIRNAQSGDVLGRYGVDNGGEVAACVFCPSGRFIAHGSRSLRMEGEGRVEVFQFGSSSEKQGKTVHRFDTPSKVSKLAFLDNNRLVVGGVDTDLTVFDLETEDAILAKKSYTHNGSVHNAWSFCHFEELAACGSKDEQLTLIDLKTMERLMQFDFGEAVKSTALWRELLACGGHTQSLVIYNLGGIDREAMEGVDNALREHTFVEEQQGSHSPLMEWESEHGRRQKMFIHNVQNDCTVDTLAFSQCGRFLACGNGNRQVNVFKITMDEDAIEDDAGDIVSFKVGIAHRFQMDGPAVSVRFNFGGLASKTHAHMLGCAGKDECVRIWDMGTDTNPYPYEVKIEDYFSNYVRKRPHLLYRKEYGTTTPHARKGNTIIHRMVEESKFEFFESMLQGVKRLLPVENDNEETPLDAAVRMNDYDKARLLLDLYTKGMLLDGAAATAIAGLPLWPRLLGAKSHVYIDQGVRVDTYYDTMTHKFPDLCATLLKRSTIRVTDLTFKEHDSRYVHMDNDIIKPMQWFLPGEPVWSKDTEYEDPSLLAFPFLRLFSRKVDLHNVAGAAVEAHITGCLNLVCVGGSFNALVRSGNVEIFQTEAMVHAIHHKWNKYGLRCHAQTTLVTFWLAAFFLTANFYSNGTSRESRNLHFCFMLLTTLVSIILARNKYVAIVSAVQEGRIRGALSKHALSVALVFWIWMLTLTSYYVQSHEKNNSNHVSTTTWFTKPGNAICVLLLLLESLACLGIYSYFGKNTRLIYEVLSKVYGFLCIMFLFLFAFAIILRNLLYLDPSRYKLDEEVQQIQQFHSDRNFTEPFETNVFETSVAVQLLSTYQSAFEKDVTEWTEYIDMFSIVFRFLFIGNFDLRDFATNNSEAFEATIVETVVRFFFFAYGVIYLIILVNLLIAILSDVYDRVKDEENARGRLARAQALVDIDHVYQSTLRSGQKHKLDENYPRCLHFLAPRNASNNRAGNEGLTKRIEERTKEMLEGTEKRLKSLLSQSAKNQAKLTAELELSNAKLVNLERDIKDLKFANTNQGGNNKGASLLNCPSKRISIHRKKQADRERRTLNNLPQDNTVGAKAAASTLVSLAEEDVDEAADTQNDGHSEDKRKEKGGANKSSEKRQPKPASVKRGVSRLTSIANDMGESANMNIDKAL